MTLGAVLFDEYLERGCNACGRARMTGAEAAAELRISAATVSQLRRGTRKPGLRLALRIQDWAGVPPAAWRTPVTEEARHSATK